MALDARNGAELWRTERPGEVTTWATPLIAEDGAGGQVVLPGTGKSRGYDLATGEALWSLAGMTVNTIPTPGVRDDVVYPDVNHKQHPAIYPPLAQLLFRGLATIGALVLAPLLMFILAFSLDGVENRHSLLFVTTLLAFFFGIFPSIDVMISERTIFERERMVNLKH